MRMSSDVGNERVVTYEVREKQKRSTAHNQDEIDRYIWVRKMDRTTYWGYSLSWYNLAGERAKWWEQMKRKGERKGQKDIKKEREKRIKREKNILHPSKYILQTTKHCSGATIRGQTLSQDHPFPPSIPSSIPPPIQWPQSTAEGKTYSVVYTEGEHGDETSDFIIFMKIICTSAPLRAT